MPSRAVHRRNNRRDWGRLVPGWGNNNVLVPTSWPKFSKRKNFRSKYIFIISILLGFFLVRTTRGATIAENLKFCNRFSPWHACCLLGYTRLREPTNKRSSHQHAGLRIWVFKKFPGLYPRPAQREEVTPSRTNRQPGLLPGAGVPVSGRRGASAPVLGPKAWPSQLFSRGCASAAVPQCQTFDKIFMCMNHNALLFNLSPSLMSYTEFRLLHVSGANPCT